MSEQNGNRPKYDGVTVYMDGKEWVIPPLSVRQFREHYQTLLDTDITPENFQSKIADRLPIVLAAINRNYPDVTPEQLLDMLDLGTFKQVIGAIANSGGIRAAKPGE